MMLKLAQDQLKKRRELEQARIEAMMQAKLQEKENKKKAKQGDEVIQENDDENNEEVVEPEVEEEQEVLNQDEVVQDTQDEMDDTESNISPTSSPIKPLSNPSSPMNAVSISNSPVKQSPIAQTRPKKIITYSTQKGSLMSFFNKQSHAIDSTETASSDVLDLLSGKFPTQPDNEELMNHDSISEESQETPETIEKELEEPNVPTTEPQQANEEGDEVDSDFDALRIDPLNDSDSEPSQDQPMIESGLVLKPSVKPKLQKPQLKSAFIDGEAV